MSGSPHEPPTSDEREWMLTVGPGHPAAHGPMAFRLRVAASGAAEVITWAEPLVYPLHRGAEKLFESRDYRQILMLADRHDWHSAFGSELGLALTAESMLGIVVPERATWIRTLMAELNRAVHHFRWLGETAWEVDQHTTPGAQVSTAQASARGASVALAAGPLRDQARAARERLIGLQEAISGGRMHPMMVQPGGLRADSPEGWTTDIQHAMAVVAPITTYLRDWVNSSRRIEGVAVMPLEQALAFGTSGPVARASGLALDLRFDDPYCAYPHLISAGVLRRVTAQTGDAQARLRLLADQLEVSLQAVAFCAERLDALGPGPVAVKLPRSFRIPEGDGYGWTENPTGINGWYLVSRGGTEPYRLKLRTASFANAQALCAILAGSPIADLPIALMSFLLVAGDLAK